MYTRREGMSNADGAPTLKGRSSVRGNGDLTCLRCPPPLPGGGGKGFLILGLICCFDELKTTYRTEDQERAAVKLTGIEQE